MRNAAHTLSPARFLRSGRLLRSVLSSFSSFVLRPSSFVLFLSFVLSSVALGGVRPSAMPPINGLRGLRQPAALADALRPSRPDVSGGPSISTRPTFPGQPGVPPFILRLSAGTVSIGQGTVRGELVADKFLGVKVGTILPGWRVVCLAQPLVSAAGDRIPLSSIFVQVLRSPSNPGVAGGPALSCEKPILVAQGRATGASLFDANSLVVRVAAGLDVPTGVYTGLLHVTAYDTNSPSAEPLANADVAINCTVPDDFTVTVTGDPMQFGSVTPSVSGTSYVTSRNTPKVVIQTNKKTLSACVVMNALALANNQGSIPGSRTALGWGATPAAALAAVAKTAIGQNTFSYDMKKQGTYTFYLAGRVSVAMADSPGSYQGQAAVTVNEQ